MLVLRQPALTSSPVATQARRRAGIVLQDALDTALVHMLCAVGDAAAVEALLAGPNDAEDSNAAGTACLRWQTELAVGTY